MKRKPFRKEALDELGFRTDTRARFRQARADFRRGWARGKRLRLGQAKRFDAALAEAVQRKRDGKPNASRHYSFHEFTCKCGLRYGRPFYNCRRIHVHRKLLRRLDTFRDKVGPISPVSGYRCPEYNRRIGGASLSQHKYGRACDVARPASLSRTLSYGLFSGIGYSASSGMVEHVDVRPGPTVTWRYSR